MKIQTQPAQVRVARQTPPNPPGNENPQPPESDTFKRSLIVAGSALVAGAVGAYAGGSSGVLAGLAGAASGATTGLVAGGIGGVMYGNAVHQGSWKALDSLVGGAVGGAAVGALGGAIAGAMRGSTAAAVTMGVAAAASGGFLAVLVTKDWPHR